MTLSTHTLWNTERGQAVTGLNAKEHLLGTAEKHKISLGIFVVVVLKSLGLEYSRLRV